MIWNHLGFSGLIWDQLGSSGVIWDHLGSSGAISQINKNYLEEASGGKHLTRGILDDSLKSSGRSLEGSFEGPGSCGRCKGVYKESPSTVEWHRSAAVCKSYIKIAILRNVLSLGTTKYFTLQ